MQLTPVGQAFLRRATAIHHEIQRARDEAGQLRGAVNGRVTLGMSTAPHLELFPDVLPAFRARFPDIHLEIVDGVYPLVEGALLDGSMDFYVGPAPARVPGELRVEKLFDNTRVILGRRAIRWRRRNRCANWQTPTGSPRPSPTRPRKNWARCSRSMACPRRSWRCGRNPR